MKNIVVTSYNNTLFDSYAFRFHKTYNWPFKLIVYNEDLPPRRPAINFYERVPELKKFVDTHKHIKFNSYRNDGVRFAYKVFAYTDAILNADEDVTGIIGIDADSVFYKPINDMWVKKCLHKDNHMMTYLGRGKHYSECGFLYWNLKHPRTKEYARAMQDLYISDKMYKLPEQHDSFLWDHMRVKFEQEYDVKNYDIGDGQVGHVQARSVLGPIYDHTKGNRKKRGRSPEARAE